MEAEKLFETSQQSLSGQMKFPEVIRRLEKIGVQSYRVDLLEKRKTFVLVSGETVDEDLDFSGPVVAAKFDDGTIRKAVRDSQQGQITYREFLKALMDAGVISYSVYLEGRKTVYYGRNGDSSYENFNF